MVRYPAGAGTVLGSSLLKDTERIVFSNSSQILSREIFTVAHEIGHQRLHISEQGTTLIEDNDFTDRDESEAEANYFAACLLMPQDKVSEFVRCEMNNGVNGLNGLNIARIQTAFNCSYDMVLFRLKTLGKLNDGQFESLKAEKSENTTERLLSVIGGNVDLCKPSQAIRIPPDYIKWVIENYNNKLIPKKSLDVALGFIGLNSEDFIDRSEERRVG